MKTLKYIAFISPLLILSLNADEILSSSQQNILDSTKQKSKKEAELIKDSWISPLSIELEKSRTKSANSSDEIDTKAISLSLSHDIYKSGAIDKTIKKGKLLLSINKVFSKSEEKALLFKVYEYVISLKKIDLQIKQTYHLVQNKEIEIKKNEDSYVNGLIDITVLDESVIELNNLENQKDDLDIQKLEILKEYKNYTSLDYKDIDLSFLTSISMQEYLEKNTNIKIKKLEDKKSILDRDITSANYLPKVTLNGSYGYEDSDLYAKADDTYSYGVSISMPLDYNANKNKEVSRLDRLIAKENLSQSKIEEENFFIYSIKKLKFIDNKISNTNKTIKRYTNLHKSVSSLYSNSLKTIDDVHIMKNRLISSKLDKQILEFEKKSVWNSLYTRVFN